MALPIEAFEAMFAQSEDPWSFRTRFYEQRKRALTVAALDRPLYRNLYEPGCANGELSAQLAPRCEAALVSDGVAAAVDLARKRLKGFPQVRVEQRVLPGAWPKGTFDCVVLSELCYFFSRTDLEAVLRLASDALTPDGTLLLCHWRAPIAGCELTGDEVHETFARSTALWSIARHEERDFRLDVWSRSPLSVGGREGLR